MTTYFEFGYLFGGVENFSFSNKHKAITNACKQGCPYIVKRQESCSYDGETTSELSLIAWGPVQVLNKENLLHTLSGNPSAYKKASASCKNNKMYVYSPYGNDSYIDADMFSSIEILPPDVMRTKKKR